MIGLRIGAAELAEIEAGAPAVVLAPGLLLPHAPPLLPLALKGGVLARPGADTARSLPLPGWVRPLAVVGPEASAEPLLPLLPPGIMVVPDAAALLGLLAGALREAAVGRGAAEAERDRLRRALGTLGPPLPQLTLDLPPAAGAEPTGLPLTQPLGRGAEGLCTIELHLAGRAARGLSVRLLAGEHVLGRWRMPAAALEPGWLALDLPEPAPFGTAEAALDITEEAGTGSAPLLSVSADRPAAGLALRLWTAPPGWAVLPLHFDWAAMGATRPALPLALPEAMLAAAVLEGGRAELIAAGAEAPRLVLEIPPGSMAVLRLPPLSPGPADLLRLRLAQRGGEAQGLTASLALAGQDGAKVESGWRRPDGAGDLALALPLPPGPSVAASLALRHDGPGPLLVELSALALQAAVAGEKRRPPPAEPPARGRSAVPLPGLPVAGGGLAPALRATPPAPRTAATGPGFASASPAPLPASPVAGQPGGAIGFQDIKLHQHLVNADGSYRHLDTGVAGLVSGGGLWRQVRFKLFERRGTMGLEFREAAGWPQMFDTWPGGGRDNFGHFWRLETDGTAEALAALTTPHDRALVAALLEVLPELAARAAGAAGLAGPEAEAWAARARRLAAAVAETRAAR